MHVNHVKCDALHHINKIKLSLSLNVQKMYQYYLAGIEENLDIFLERKFFFYSFLQCIGIVI